MSTYSPENLAVARLYVALMGRAPDADGFAFWGQAIANGASETTLARGFLGSPEGQTIYSAAQTGEQFVASFYTSVLGRAPDADGLAFWAAALAAQGGIADINARASLITQILSIASTPLTTRPEGLSDTEYAQTMADRARLINQTEFGVYFATELRSNDVTMAKKAMALVTDDPASLVAARNFPITGGVVPAPPTPTLAISSTDSVDDITTRFNDYPASIATVDATGMSAAQQAAVADAVAKIAAGGISKLSLVLGDALVTDAVTSALLGKATGATVDASGATPTEVAALIGSLGNIAADGISGALPLDSTIGDADIANLFAKYSGTTAVVNASGMTGVQLAAVAAVEPKLAAGGIFGLSLALGAVEITDAISITLLAKATAASVDVSGATDTEIAALAASITNIAADGISGALALTSVTAATDITALMGKYAGSTATINAADMTVAQQAAVAAAAPTKVAAGGIANLSLVLNDALVSDAVTTALLAKATGATVDASGATSNEVTALAASLANIAPNGISGALPIDSTIAATAIPDLFAKYTGTTAVVNASGMDTAQLQAVAAASTKIATNGITNLALNQTALTLDDTQATALLAKATGASFDATSALESRLLLVADNIIGVADDGITGSATLTSAMTVAQLAALLGPKMTVAATVQIDAASMTMAQLAVVGDNPSKIDGLSNLPTLDLGSASITAGVANELLSRVTDASVIATGASTANIDVLFIQLAKIADLGISGVLPLSAAQLAATSAATLEPKLAAGASLSVTGTSSDETFDISAYTHGVTVNGGAGQDTLVITATTDLDFNAAPANFTSIENLQIKGASSGMLTLTTSNAQSLNSIKVANAGGVTITVNAGKHEEIGGQGLIFDARDSGTTIIDASAAIDINTFVQETAATLYAGSGGGRLVGTVKNDIIIGGAGDDIIVGDGVYVGSKGVAEVQTLTLSGKVSSEGTYTMGSFEYLISAYYFTASELARRIYFMEDYEYRILKSDKTIADVSTTFGSEPVYTITYSPTAGDVGPLGHSYTGTGLIAGAAVEVVKGKLAVDFVGTVAAAAADILTGGGGKNTFVFAKNSSTVDAFDTITDLNLGDGSEAGVVDKLLFQTSATTASVAVLDVDQLGQLAAATTLADAVRLALDMAPAAGTALLFARGTDQFLLFNGDGNTSFNNTADFIIKVVASGTLDVSDIMLVA